MRADLRSRLVALGTSDDDIDRAEAEGWLPLLAFERLLLPGARRYDLAALVDAAGIDESLARGLWRAVGFPDVPSGLAVFTDRDVEAARLAFAQASPREIRNGTLLQQVRVIGGALARVASVEAATFTELLDEARREGPRRGRHRARDSRRHALRRDRSVDRLRASSATARRRRGAIRCSTPSPVPPIAVGFADLAGYTALERHARRDADLRSRRPLGSGCLRRGRDERCAGGEDDRRRSDVRGLGVRSDERVARAAGGRGRGRPPARCGSASRPDR